jgi:acyl-CoA thioester hydrolase
MEKYTYQITVGPEAIDLFGHVNNIEYVRWVQDAARMHSLHVGYGWEEYRALGAAFVIRRHEIDYLRPAHLGETLDVTTWIASHTRISAVRATEIRNAQGELIVNALTTWVYVSLTTMRPQRIPDEIRRTWGG